MRRRILRLGLTALLATLGGALGLVTALAASPPGRRLLARAASELLTTALRGQVSIGAVGGSFFRGLTFRDLVILDDAGQPFARIPRALLDYQLRNLLGGRLVLDRMVLVEPEFVIVQRRSGRTNLEEILRLGEGSGGGTPPLVEFRRVLIVTGDVQVRTPWNPPDGAVTPVAVAEALRGERLREGREISMGADGLQRVIRLERLTGSFARITVSTPDRRPISLEVDSLSMDVSDPPVIVRDFAGRLEVRGDTLAFDVARAVLPGTELSGAGLVHWESGPLRFDFRLAAPRADLEDIRWISPAFPAMTGRAQVVASSPAPGRNDFAIEGLVLSAPDGSEVEGRLTTVVIDGSDDLGLDDLALRLRNVDLEHFKGFLDTIPLDGRLSGSMESDGRMSDLAVRLDWAFADARLPGRPVSRLAGAGRVRLGGADGLTFRGFNLASSDLWLPTVREVAPPVVLEGRLEAAGTLEGPWRAVTFRGVAVHRDGDRPASRVEGEAFLDLRGTESFIRADLAVTTLDFEGIRAGFPGLATRGAVTGHVALEGTTDRMRVVSTLDGEIGHLETDGWFALDYPARWGGDSAVLRFRGLDLSVLAGTGPPTRLSGTVLVDGIAGTNRVPDGQLDLALGAGSVREFTFDSLRGVVSVRDSLLGVSGLLLAWPAGQLAGEGTLGWTTGRQGSMRFVVEAGSLRGFDDLAHALAGMTPDSLSLAQPLRGVLTGSMTLEGSLDSLSASADVALQDAGWRQVAFPAAELSADLVTGTPGSIRLDASAPDLRLGGRRFTALRLGLAGRPDSLDWSAGVDLGGASTIGGGGSWSGEGLERFTLVADSLALQAGGHAWALEEPVTLVRADSAVTLSPVRLAATDGAGLIRTEGNPPFGTPGNLRLELIGVRLHDMFRLMQRDTTIRGVLDADLLLGGTRRLPTFAGSVSLADLMMRDFRAPFVQGVLNYQDRTLDANLLLWKTGTRVLTVRAALPLDLALARVQQRKLPGPLEVAARADSVDLGIVEAFTSTVRAVEGVLNADLAVEGQWAAPRLRGSLAVDGGAASVPGLGVRYTGIVSRATFRGDSMLVDSLVVRGGEGRLTGGGGVRFEDLTRPRLDLRLESRDFRAIDVPNYLTVEATGDLQLTGPVFGATLRGQLLAERGQLYFADLVMKDIVNLEDPTIADLIDTTLIRSQGLGAAFQSRFLDSLRISDLRLEIGDDFWLRSSEANIQVDGQVLVNKVRQDYRFDGTFNARRGTYVLNLGFVTRDFTVQRGTVRYFGTPDLNAELDIEAEHVIRPIDDPEDIVVTARIRGTLLAPELTLSSDVSPPLTETDIVSYLMFGRPSTNLAGGGAPGSSERLALDAGLSVLSSEIERTLISDFGVPIDFIQIRPVIGSSTTSGGGSGVVELRAGWQVGRQWFLTFNAGLCGFSQFSYNSVGASVEYRFLRHWRAQLSVEPLLVCIAGSQVDPLATTGRYQVGLDLFWEKEY